MRDNSRAASIVAVMGATGSGKSTAICSKLAVDDGERRLIWNPGGDYDQYGTVTDSQREVYRMVTRSRSWRVVFNPSFDQDQARAQFGWFCQVAFECGDCLVVADELEDVMTASWAPAGWRALIRKGRKRGCQIIAASQVPAGIEKRFWDQATVIRSGRLNGKDSADTVARVLMVPAAEVLALPELCFIQRSIARPVVTWGRIEWGRGGPREVVIREKNISPGAPG
jgi:hypothetical protein